MCLMCNGNGSSQSESQTASNNGIIILIPGETSWDLHLYYNWCDSLLPSEAGG